MPTVTLRPDGDYNAAWSAYPAAPRWDDVDEETPNGDTDYIYTASSAIQQLFNLTASGLSGVTIDNVRVYANARKTTADANAIRLRVRTHDTDYNAGPAKDLTESYADYYDDLPTNPYTGASWTIEEVDALIAGVHSQWVAIQKRVTALWVVITYSAAPPPAVGGETKTLLVLTFG